MVVKAKSFCSAQAVQAGVDL